MTTSKDSTGSTDLVPASPPGELAETDLSVIAGHLVDQARADGIALTGDGGLLPALVARVLETGLQAELTEHLGYERHAVDGRGSGNSRNGSFPKTVTTEIGEVDLAVPRDRNGTFEPALVPHGERRLDGLEAQIISLYLLHRSTTDHTTLALTGARFSPSEH